MSVDDVMDKEDSITDEVTCSKEADTEIDPASLTDSLEYI